MAKTASMLITRRIPIGGTDAIYLGTITPDAEYETGGDTLTLAANSVVGELPTRFHHLFVHGAGTGITGEWVTSSQKLKLYLGAESGAGIKGSKEGTAAADYSSVAFSFVAFGA